MKRNGLFVGLGFVVLAGTVAAEEPARLDWKLAGGETLNVSWTHQSKVVRTRRSTTSVSSKRQVTAVATVTTSMSGRGSLVLEIASATWQHDCDSYRVLVEWKRGDKAPRVKKTLLDPNGSKDMEERVREMSSVVGANYRIDFDRTRACVCTMQGMAGSSVSSLFGPCVLYEELPEAGLAKSSKWKDLVSSSGHNLVTDVAWSVSMLDAKSIKLRGRADATGKGLFGEGREKSSLTRDISFDRSGILAEARASYTASEVTSSKDFGDSSSSTEESQVFTIKRKK